MSPRPFRLLVTLSLLLPAAVAAHAGSAAACLNEVVQWTQPQIQQATIAETALGTGKPAKAAQLLLEIHPRLRISHRLLDRGPGQGIDPVAARAQRLLAVAVVRTEGLVDLGDAYPGASAADRRTNLEWAIGILRAFARLSPGPAIDSDLGEALSKLPETRAEASRILEDLAHRDLVTSPEAYRALAELRLAAGDQAGHDSASRQYEAKRHRAAPPPSPVGRPIYSANRL
jgi:hypothetical protein